MRLPIKKAVPRKVSKYLLAQEPDNLGFDPSLGSTSAKMQSEATKAMNQGGGASTGTQGVAGHTISETMKAEGGGPTRGMGEF